MFMEDVTKVRLTKECVEAIENMMFQNPELDSVSAVIRASIMNFDRKMRCLNEDSRNRRIK